MKLGVPFLLAHSFAMLATAQTSPSAQAGSATIGTPDETMASSARARGVPCDAVETPHSSPHGVYQYSSAVGTDATAGVADWVRSLGATAKLGRLNQLAVPIGAGPDQTAATSFQKTARLPSNCGILVQTWPAMPDGVRLEGNNTTIFVQAPNGNGPLWINNNNGDVPGTSNDLLEGVRVVYVGPPGASTGIGGGFIGGGSDTLHGNTFAGFHIGALIAGVQLSEVSGNTFAHNDVGLNCTTASFNVPSYTAKEGTPSINLQFFSNTIRSNKINVVMNGCNTSTILPGSWSNGSVAGLIMGAPDFTYIDRVRVEGGAAAVCTPNAMIPVTVPAGSSTLPAELLLATDSEGHVTGGFSINGGKGYSENGTIRGSVPASGALSCTRPPTSIVAHATHMTVNSWAGAANAGTSQNTIFAQNMENEGSTSDGVFLRPSTGFQIVLDLTANDNQFLRMVNGLSSGTAFARFMRNEGLNNIVVDPLIGNYVDPITGSTCPFINVNGPGLELHTTRPNGDPSRLTCSPDGQTYYGPNVTFIGFDPGNGNVMAPGFTAVGRSAADTILRSYAPGDSFDRFSVQRDGTVSFGSGAAPPDARISRAGTRFFPDFGSITGLTSGVNPNRPVAIGFSEGNLDFSWTFISTDRNATYPNVGSTGIPAKAACTATWVFDGVGSRVAAHYGAVAHCNDGQGGGDRVYQSHGQPLGSEVWVPSPATVHGITATVATAPAGVCYQKDEFVFSQDGHVSFCPAQGATWQRKF